MPVSQGGDDKSEAWWTRCLRFAHVLVPGHVQDVRDCYTAQDDGHHSRGSRSASITRNRVRVDVSDGHEDGARDTQCGHGKSEYGDSKGGWSERVLEHESLRMVSLISIVSA